MLLLVNPNARKALFDKFISCHLLLILYHNEKLWLQNTFDSFSFVMYATPSPVFLNVYLPLDGR